MGKLLEGLSAPLDEIQRLSLFRGVLLMPLMPLMPLLTGCTLRELHRPGGTGLWLHHWITVSYG
jgi:hypothetical protein